MSSKQRQFDALVRSLSGDLFRYGYWLCGDEALAHDLVQETFLRAWRALDHLRDTTAAKAWLITILRREHAHMALLAWERPQLRFWVLPALLSSRLGSLSPIASMRPATSWPAHVNSPAKIRPTSWIPPTLG